MSSPAHTTAHPPGLGPYLREKTGINAAACYQCGKCSAGCPMAAETRLRPHDVLRLINLDRKEDLLEDESIWLCLTCETCSARCPNGCDPARLIDALREEALERAPRRIRAFHRSFLNQIQLGGRMFEFGLVLEYKLRTGTFTQDAASTPAMLRRGKLKFLPRPINGVADVRRIFEACQAEEEDS